MGSARTRILLAVVLSGLFFFESELMLPASGFKAQPAAFWSAADDFVPGALDSSPVGCPAFNQAGQPIAVAAARRSRYRRRYRKSRRKPTRRPVRYAYPLDFFMLNAPEFDKSPLSGSLATDVKRAFYRGTAGEYPARALVRAGLVKFYPLRGGIFWRREPVKFVIIHSTETGVPVGATRVIDSWSSLGRRHAGAQYVVERDGTIYQSVDPDLGCVHVNIFKTLSWINNDNTIGIEMVHSGNQSYPAEQKAAVIRLTSYLQSRYHVKDPDVITHRYAQQGDHTDPVNFDWERFKHELSHFNRKAELEELKALKNKEKRWVYTDIPFATTFLEPHGKIKINGIFPMPDSSVPKLETKPSPEAQPIKSVETGSDPSALRRHMEMSPDQAQTLISKPLMPPDKNGAKSKSGKDNQPAHVDVDNDYPYAPVPGVGIEMVP